MKTIYREVITELNVKNVPHVDWLEILKLCIYGMINTLIII